MLPDEKEINSKQMKGMDLEVFLCHRGSLWLFHPRNHLSASVFVHPSCSPREAGRGSCCLIITSLPFLKDATIFSRSDSFMQAGTRVGGIFSDLTLMSQCVYVYSHALSLLLMSNASILIWGTHENTSIPPWNHLKCSPPRNERVLKNLYS